MQGNKRVLLGRKELESDADSVPSNLLSAVKPLCRSVKRALLFSLFGDLGPTSPQHCTPPVLGPTDPGPQQSGSAKGRAVEIAASHLNRAEAKQGRVAALCTRL